MAEQLPHQSLSVNNFYFAFKNFVTSSLKAVIYTPIFFTPKLDIKFIFLLTFTNGKLLPLRASNRFTASLIVDLLLLTDGSKESIIIC